MSDTEAGSAFLQLPRELRDEIYGYYFNKSCVVFRAYYHRKPTDLAILRVSKAIGNEASRFLFSKATKFLYDLSFDLTFDPVERFSAPPTREVTDRMTNVEFNILIYAYYRTESKCSNFITDPICEATVDLFIATTFIRDQFRLKIQLVGQFSFIGIREFVETRFFQTLKRFNGFRELSVMIDWYIPDGLSESEGLEKEVRELPLELEPGLGPFVANDVIQLPTPSCRALPGIHITLTFNFEPLQFHVGKLQNEAVPPVKQTERLQV